METENLNKMWTVLPLLIIVSIIATWSIVRVYGVTLSAHRTATTSMFYIDLMSGQGLAGSLTFIAREDGVAWSEKRTSVSREIEQYSLSSEQVTALRKALDQQSALSIRSQNCVIVDCPLDAPLFRVTVALDGMQNTFECQKYPSSKFAAANCRRVSVIIEAMMNDFTRP